MRQPPVALACLHEKAPVQALRDLVAYTVHVYIYMHKFGAPDKSGVYTHTYMLTQTHIHTPTTG